VFVDTRTLPDGTVITADICIVGGGAAGITLARDLADGKRSVALFESGAFEFAQETQNLYEAAVVGQSFPPLVMDRLRFFGGTTNHWAGSCRPFDPIDFEERSYIKNSGWPFGRDALDAFYGRAQAICELGPYPYDPEDWQTDRAAPISFGPDARLRTGVYQYSPPTRFGAVYRQDLAAADGVTIYLNANLVDIDTDGEAHEVTGLRFACLQGPKIRAQANHYVLATGGIENARLLLNANKVQRAGLGNGFGMVGRYFMDHPYIRNVATILFNEASVGSRLYEQPSRDGHPAQFYFYAPAATLEREKLPGFSIWIERVSVPSYGFGHASTCAIAEAFASGNWPDHLLFHIGEILRGQGDRLMTAYSSLTQRAPASYEAAYICECPPDPDSRVTLVDDVDALGLRRVQLDWHLPPDLDKNVRRALELLALDLGGAGIGRVRLNLEEEEDVAPSVLNGHHHMGTTRMHRDPKHGVVDANCRVHGMTNLFVAGSSVFPTYSFDDPTLTIVALALRLSDHLKTISV
jgi:choline dehydrogenase-like flavoprotein